MNSADSPQGCASVFTTLPRAPHAPIVRECVLQWYLLTHTWLIRAARCGVVTVGFLCPLAGVFKGVVSDWKCRNASKPWLAEGRGKPRVIGPNPSDTLFFSFFFFSMQSVYIRSELRISWLPLRARRESKWEREGGITGVWICLCVKC